MTIHNLLPLTCPALIFTSALSEMTQLTQRRDEDEHDRAVHHFAVLEARIRSTMVRPYFVPRARISSPADSSAVKPFVIGRVGSILA